MSPMTPQRPFPASFAALLALLALAAPPAARADVCPADTWQIQPCPWSMCGEPAVQSNSATAFTAGGPAAFATVTADHALGTGRVVATSDACDGIVGAAGEARLRAVDDFVLVGPGSAPVSITAVVTALLSGGHVTQCFSDPNYGDYCYDYFGAMDVSVRQGTTADSLGWADGAGPVPPLTDLHVTFSAVPGVPFRLTVTDHARSAGCTDTATASHELRFPNLPVGYTVVPCKGGPAVATRKKSWGEIKTLYR